MLRFRASTNASVAYQYFSKSDSGLEASDLRNEVGGKVAAMLGIAGEPDFEQFRRVLNGFDPHTGEQLTAKIVPGRISYWDITASVPKSVTIAIENGDSRVADSVWEAGREAMADIEATITTRVRKGGEQDDRVTGNLLYHAFGHFETRPNRDDGMPDPDFHIHFCVSNLTYDPVEREFKAIKFRPIMDLRKYFDRRFDARLASKLTDLGYSIDTRYKSDPKGGKSYFSWDIKGIPESAIKKFSRRGEEVDQLADALGIESATSKDKLGATSRLHKRTDKNLADYREYWAGRLTDQEKEQIASAIAAANLGQNPEPLNTVEKGVEYAISHEFERRSVLDWHDLAVTAMERTMGGAHPDAILPEAIRQGVLLKGGEATTKSVLAEEQRIIGFAREGKGTMRPLAAKADLSIRNTDHLTLSAEQLAMVSHVLHSTDQLLEVVGNAGTGKTHAVRSAFEKIKVPVEMLAPSAVASRDVLRAEGFSNADTVASFLNSQERQQAVKGGVIWIDEAGLLAIKDLSRLVDVARAQHARLILQGDPKQHRSVVRHGNMMNVLQEYAGIKPGRLTEIWRQKHSGYKAIVANIAGGKQTDAFDKLADMGWVQQVEDNTPLVNDYMQGIKAGKTQLVVAPSHAEGDDITDAIRARLKEEGKLGTEEKTFEQLVPLNWSVAERGDLQRYDGQEVMQFHRNSGTFKAGQTVRFADQKPTDHFKSAEHFSVYGKSEIALAAGDLVRITSNGKTADGHRLNNGSVYRIKGFDKNGIVLENDWTIPSDFKHLAHGYVTTSHASQGKTVDRVLIGMGSESRGAINAEQFYVSVSRGRESAKVYTDLQADELKQVIKRTDLRKSATELMHPKPKRKAKRTDMFRRLMKRARDRFKSLHAGLIGDTREIKQREIEYAGRER